MLKLIILAIVLSSLDTVSESDKLKILLAVRSCKSFSSLYASIRFSSFDIEVKTLNSTCE